MQLDKVRMVRLNTYVDGRGKLTAIEGIKDVPFEIKRIFYMHDVIKGNKRGGHAHRETDQIAIAISGKLRVFTSDGIHANEFSLDNAEVGLLLPKMTWTVLEEFSAGAVCLVLANSNYDKSMSIRTWEEYLAVKSASLVDTN